uniref:Cilia- and flagella-associated protein 161 n=1 Tax=Gouania willdenowi TaxID=441366 RepID=A0A8C5DTH7_GOUWI
MTSYAVCTMCVSFQDAMKEYLEKKERGELCAQRVDLLKQNILEPVTLSMSKDGGLHFGDVVMLVNVGSENRECSTVSINADLNSLRTNPSPGIRAPCGVAATRSVHPCTRTAFIISSVDGSPDGSTLNFDQNFALRSSSGFAMGLYLTSDLRSFQKCAKKSRLQEVNLDDGVSFLSWWKVEHVDPQQRLESEGLPVPANMKVVIKHRKTNQALAVLGDHILRTMYGKEYEVKAHTFLDSHRAEQDNNHWILCTADTGGEGRVFPYHSPSALDNNNRPSLKSESDQN